MTYIYQTLPPNTNFCVKNHKFRMTGFDKYMYWLCEHQRRKQNFLDMLIGPLTADMYQILKEKSIKKVLMILLDNFIL